MNRSSYCEYQVQLIEDKKTGQIVAEIPTLDISDYGPNAKEALQRLTRMVSFHLECLVAEGKPIPRERRTTPGLYLRVKPPIGVA